MLTWKKTIITALSLITISIILTTSTYGAQTTTNTLSSSGSITVSAGLGVYSDSACKNSVTSIDWGSLSPGQSVSRTVYIKNIGSGVSLTLSLSTSNWSPTAASNYMAVTWVPTSYTLAPGASTQATITLTVSSSITDITNFSVQISIAGTSA